MSGRIIKRPISHLIRYFCQTIGDELKLMLAIILIFLTLLADGQKKNETIKVLAKLISPGLGDKILIAKYKVIKVVKSNVTNDTIKVGYYFYNAYQNLNKKN